jgi:hypothetical protein
MLSLIFTPACEASIQGGDQLLGPLRELILTTMLTLGSAFFCSIDRRISA